MLSLLSTDMSKLYQLNSAYSGTLMSDPPQRRPIQSIGPKSHCSQVEIYSPEDNCSVQSEDLPKILSRVIPM